MEGGRHFIAFARFRKNVEIVLKESRDRLGAAGFLEEGLEHRIAGYRGGYTPKERKSIENRMISGQLLGLISTNALELGIDIGSLDTTVLIGYPGTRASFWQQTGRAGRNKERCTNFLILENRPFDQYIAIDPDWLLEKESENAIVDRDNLQIQLCHIRAAAAEMPLTLDDIALFPDLGEVIPVLLEVEEVREANGRFSWLGSAFPAEVSQVYRSLLQRYENGQLVQNNHFEGMCSALKNAAMMVTMTAADDIDAIISNNALVPFGEEGEQIFLFLYDKYVGGLGYAQKIYGMMGKILENAIRMVENCRCQDGCPACVGDYKLDKKMVLWGLKSLLFSLEVPQGVKIWERPPLPEVKKAFSFAGLEQDWDAFIQCLKKNGERNSAFFGTVLQVKVGENCLELTVGSKFYEKWANQSDNAGSLKNVLCAYTDCPAKTVLKITAQEDEGSSALMRDRLRRKMGGPGEE